MLKKTIKYVDFDGDAREETFYFNYTKAELLRMNLRADGGLENTLRKIIAEKDVQAVGEFVWKIIVDAYGEKSSDGSRFVKSEELSRQFEQTQAFSDLFVELLGDAKKLAEFIEATLPPDLALPAQSAE